jgi:hypothetical protein
VPAVAATDDLTGELIKFNAFLASEQDRERQQRAEKKAAKAREDAAATLKKVMADGKASKEDKDAAEAAWKDAVAAEERIKAGEAPEPAAEPEAAAEEAEPPADEAPAEEPAPEPEPAEEPAPEPEPEQA